MKNTAETKELLFEQLKKNPILETACSKIGISNMTLYRWRKDSKKFNRHVEDALLEGRVRINGVAESQIIAMIGQGKIEASKYWLNHNDPRYSNKLEIVGTLKDAPLSVEQRSVIKQALKLTSKFNDKKEK